MRSRRPRPILPALALLAVGVWLLIGCIPIPATRQYQTNGTLRPERFVGKRDSDSVRLGVTQIDDAFIDLSQRVKGSLARGFMAYGSMKIPLRNSINRWSVSPDGRHFAVGYHVRTTLWVMPLCFMAEWTSESRWLDLEINDANVVVSSRTLDQPPPYAWPMPPGRWLEVFNDAQREKLRNAGVFPTDDELAREQAQFDQYRSSRIVRRPTSSPVR